MNAQEKKLEALLKKVIIYKGMKNVTVYMGPMCAFCDAAKRLLVRNKISYKEINIAIEEGKMDEMLSKANGKKTIPQIFFIMVLNFEIRMYNNIYIYITTTTSFSLTTKTY